MTWWGFTSTTTDPEVPNAFIANAEQSTLFNISGKDLWGYDIQAFSKFTEKEVVLEPEARVKVSSVVHHGSSALTVNVELQAFEHFVLEDIIKMPRFVKEVKGKKKVKVKEVPEGLKVENTTDKAVELLWSPVKGRELCTK